MKPTGIQLVGQWGEGKYGCGQVGRVGCFCQENIWIEGQVGMPFQIGGGHYWEWGHGVCI
jgi:hypothetical protein